MVSFLAISIFNKVQIFVSFENLTKQHNIPLSVPYLVQSFSKNYIFDSNRDANKTSQNEYIELTLKKISFFKNKLTISTIAIIKCYH